MRQSAEQGLAPTRNAGLEADSVLAPDWVEGETRRPVAHPLDGVDAHIFAATHGLGWMSLVSMTPQHREASILPTPAHFRGPLPRASLAAVCAAFRGSLQVQVAVPLQIQAVPAITFPFRQVSLPSTFPSTQGGCPAQPPIAS